MLNLCCFSFASKASYPDNSLYSCRLPTHSWCAVESCRLLFSPPLFVGTTQDFVPAELNSLKCDNAHFSDPYLAHGIFHVFVFKENCFGLFMSDHFHLHYDYLQTKRRLGMNQDPSGVRFVRPGLFLLPLTKLAPA